MLESFAALFAAHVAADYLAQTGHMVRNKHQPTMIALHIALVFAFAALAVGFTGWVALAVLTGLHAAMDLIKTHLLPGKKLWPYLLDQAVHILTITGVAAYAPDLISQGLWAQLWPQAPETLTPLFLIAGFAVFAVRAGGFAVELLLTPLPPTAPAAALGAPLAGLRIGQLERGLVFLLMLIGQPAGIAFLIAAKSILRFGAVKDDRAASEYVIIGTLASVGWAILCAAALIMLLPDGTLETLRPTP